MNEDYLKRLEGRLEALSPLLVERAITVRRPTDSVPVIRLDLRFLDGARFEGNETWAGRRRKYRFHLMDGEGTMVWRLDNAPHHPEVATHPHHRHSAGGHVDKGAEVTLEEVLVTLGRRDVH